MGQSMCNPLELIQGAGLRATKPRVAVLSFLASRSFPCSIKDIQKHVGKTIDLVTLYRMMEDFEKAGVIRRIHLGKGERFEVNNSEDHHHIVCTTCDRVEDFSDNAHEKLTKRILKRSRSFATITDHSFELYGLCNACFKNITSNISSI